MFIHRNSDRLRDSIHSIARLQTREKKQTIENAVNTTGLLYAHSNLCNKILVP